MLVYILKRLLIIIPTLFAIMVISFLISRSTPGDPIMREMATQDQPGVKTSRDRNLKEYKRISKKLGLDLPVFYLSLSSLAYPDTLHKIVHLSERESLAEMVSEYGNWDQISAYYHAVCDLEVAAFEIPPFPKNNEDLQEVKLALSELRETSGASEIRYRFDLIDSICPRYPEALAAIHQGFAGVKAKYAAVENEATRWKLYIPTLNWNGFSNQFHHWMMRMFSLDFGKSYVDKRPVKDKIKDALPWTLFMSFVSFLIAYAIAIPIGVYSVRNRNTWQDQAVTTGLFLLFSIPSFVMAMVLITFLCNPDYFYLFPTSGVLSDGAETWPFWDRMLDYAYHLTLPTLVISYRGVAFLSRQMRVGMLDTVNMDYIRTARAKGLSERVVIWKHAMRNSVLPIITHLAGLLPGLIVGAVITETIFSIPGMGRLTIQSTFFYDHPVVITIFTFAGILTLLGILLADILYAVADPRISFSKR